MVRTCFLARLGTEQYHMYMRRGICIAATGPFGVVCARWNWSILLHAMPKCHANPIKSLGPPSKPGIQLNIQVGLHLVCLYNVILVVVCFVSGMVRSASSSGDRIVNLRQVCRTTSRSVILKHSRECWALPLLRRLLIGTTLLSMLARNVVCKLFFHCVDALRRFRHVDRSHLFQGRSGEVFGRVLLHTTASKVHHWRPTCIAYLDKLRRNFGLHLSWLALVLPWEQLLLILSAQDHDVDETNCISRLSGQVVVHESLGAPVCELVVQEAGLWQLISVPGCSGQQHFPVPMRCSPTFGHGSCSGAKEAFTPKPTKKT